MGLISCFKMRLFVLCSVDGFVRIWDEVNRLLCIIKLNVIFISICFCSQKGDLIVGIGKYFYKISYVFCKCVVCVESIQELFYCYYCF